MVEHDQGVRIPPDRAKMAALAPAFKPDGVVTAGNSSQISDGAGAVLLASERAVRQHGLKPMARLVARVVVGSDPVLMLDGPIPATRKILDARRAVDRRDRRHRDQRGLRLGRAAWQAEIGPIWTRSTPTAAPSPTATRWVRPAPS